MSKENSWAAVSEVYQPQSGNEIIDEPPTDHYQKWGYSIGYEVDAAGQPVPETCNTAVFRIMPEGMTEPVYVTKPEIGSRFEIQVLSGRGKLIQAFPDDRVEEHGILAGDRFVILPGQAYSYQNIDAKEDLILHDVARPAFQTGDDIDVTVSAPKNGHEPDRVRYGRQLCVVNGENQALQVVELPTSFYDAVGRAMAGHAFLDSR